MGYDETPWIFKGRALYQLQLVKSEVAKRFIPPELKLVEFFGYTIGGFYLAKYNDSPVGPFDELVVLSGLAWNPPTSCAWASRVYVNNKTARDHGLKSVGLPSRLAHWRSADDSISVSNIDNKKWLSKKFGSKPSVCTFVVDSERHFEKVRGPRIKLTLPSYSGRTPDMPKLLKYTCQLDTRVGLVKPIPLRFEETGEDKRDELTATVLNGKPLISFLFDDMTVSPSFMLPYPLLSALDVGGPAEKSREYIS